MSSEQRFGARDAPRTVLTQTWSQIVWAHWRVEPTLLCSLLPAGLAPQVFDGSAWVGLVPFEMSNLKLPGVLTKVTSLVGVKTFGEVNVRTYVIGPDGRTGVWFLTLDADRLLAVMTARIVMGLPYRHARTSLEISGVGEGARLSWTSQRYRDRAQASIDVIAHEGKPRLAAAGLEHFLVERYAMYTMWHGRLLRGSLSHPSWLVRSASESSVTTGTLAAAGITVTGAPHVLVGEPVDVTIHPLKFETAAVRS